VRVDGSVTSSSGQVLVLSVWDVQVRLGVSVFLGKTKIDDVDLVAALSNAHQEVVRLDITMDEVSRVDVLDTRDELIGKEKDGLQAELAVAEVEQVFKRRSTTNQHLSIRKMIRLTAGREPLRCSRTQFRTI